MAVHCLFGNAIDSWRDSDGSLIVHLYFEDSASLNSIASANVRRKNIRSARIMQLFSALNLEDI